MCAVGADGASGVLDSEVVIRGVECFYDCSAEYYVWSARKVAARYYRFIRCICVAITQAQVSARTLLRAKVSRRTFPDCERARSGPGQGRCSLTLSYRSGKRRTCRLIMKVTNVCSIVIIR